MAEPHVISGLKVKQEEDKKRISDLKKQVRESQLELSTISKTHRIFGENPRTGGNKLFRRGELPRIIFDTLREAGRGLDIEEIAAAVMKAEGIGDDDPEPVATVRQRCTMALYRYYDKRQVAKERRGSMRVWRLQLESFTYKGKDIRERVEHLRLPQILGIDRKIQAFIESGGIII